MTRRSAQEGAFAIITGQDDHLQRYRTVPTPAMEKFAAAILEVTGSPLRNGMAPCPAHDDNKPSLSVTSTNGRLLIHCHAGCPIDDVLAALQLKKSDLFDESSTRSRPEGEGEWTPAGPALDVYRYTDEDGNVCLEVLRCPGKQFLQRVPDQTRKSGHRWKVGDARKPLYRLPQVLKGIADGRLVWVVEGEKDVHTLEALGEVATCNPGGAGKWRQEHTDALAEAVIAIVADRDDVGRKHARDVGAVLTEAGATVTRYEAAEGKDVTDHIQSGKTLEQLVLLNSDELHTRSISPPSFGDEDDGPAWPVLDNAALYGLAGKIVRTVGPETEADPVALLVTTLVAFGAAVGRGPHARVGGAQHPARLNVLLVGDSSKARKGTSWSEVRRVLAEADPVFASDRVLNGFGSGESLIDAVAPKNNESVVDQRLLVYESEWARLLGVARRDGSTMSPVLRQAWDGDRLAVRSRTGGTTVADNAHIALIAHITLEELRLKLSETEQANGFANRHIFVLVRRSKLLPNGGNLDESEIQRLGGLLRQRLHEARQMGVLSRTPDAEAVWKDLYHQMDADKPGGLLGDVVARDQAQMLRLSVTFALLDGSNRIDVPHLTAAWAVWRYSRASAELIFGDSLGDPVADKIEQAVSEAGHDGLDRTAISGLFGRHVPAATRDKAINRLAVLDRIEIVSEVTAGRSRSVLRKKRIKRNKTELGNDSALDAQPSVELSAHLALNAHAEAKFIPTDEDIQLWVDSLGDELVDL